MPSRCRLLLDPCQCTDPPNPVDGVGYWTWCDEIFGAGIWIDLPDKHGVVFMPSLGHGHLRYIWGLHQHGASGTPPLHLRPEGPGGGGPGQQAALAAEAPGLDRAADAACRSRHLGRLFRHGIRHGLRCPDPHPVRVVPASYSMGGQENYPLVHGWRIKETYYTGDINKDLHVDVVTC